MIRHPDGSREVIVPNVKLVYKPNKARLLFRHEEVLTDGSTRLLIGRIGKTGKKDRVVIKVVEAGAESTPASLYQLHTDQLATIHTITDKDQTIVWRGEHDAFGQTYATIEALDNPLRFLGQYEDEETGLHYNWHRYYNPATGRYIASDPIGLAGGLNTFGYVDSNPLRFLDMTGLSIYDVGKIRNEFHRSIKKLNEQGRRSPGSSIVNMLWNNANAYYNPWSDFERCYDQSERILNDINRLTKALDDNWELRMATKPGHYWGELVSSNPNDPVIKVDPLYEEFSTIDEATPDTVPFYLE